MTFSANGAKTMSGEGVAAVRKKIEDAFRDARTNVRTHSAETRIETEEEVDLSISLDATTPQPIQVRALAERAEPFFRACERRLRAVVKRNSPVHYISVPTERAEQLYAGALRSLASHSE